MEIMTLDKTHGREKKSLLERNLQLRNTMRSLNVSAAYIHLTALLLGGIIFMYHKAICMTIASPIRFDYEAAKAPKLVLSVR
jgi:hypothetical protein